MQAFKILILCFCFALSLKASMNDEIEHILKQSVNSKAFKNYAPKKDLKNLGKKFTAQKALNIPIYEKIHVFIVLCPVLPMLCSLNTSKILI